MIKEAISALIDGRSLTEDEAAAAMGEIMQGEVTGAQFGAFVTALRVKGETVDELVGFARTMRAHAVPVKVSGQVVDTCGTGGDGMQTFNISTVTAIVAAGAGLTVAKHGNRAMSSRCGSADLLEALGVKIDLGADGVRQCLERAGIGFMFAPVFHPAMKHAAAHRREIGIRTVFNFLGPITNPAGAGVQVLGVAEASLLEKIAGVFLKLGSSHALVVHGEDGLDEVTLSGETRIFEVKEWKISEYSVTPEELGLGRAGVGEYAGADAAGNADITRRVLSGEPGPHLDVVLANAAAVLLAADRVDTLAGGVALARETVTGGKAAAKLDELVAVSNELAA